jgi:hypothetical protein
LAGSGMGEAGGGVFGEQPVVVVPAVHAAYTPAWRPCQEK